MDETTGIVTKLQSEFDFEIIDEFITHFEVMQNSMEITILNLEKVEYYKNGVNELFRIFHNLKSSTSFLKLDDMHYLCVKTENSLSVARKLDGPASSAYVDWLLEVEDQFGLWLSEFQKDLPLSRITATEAPPLKMVKNNGE